MSSLSKGLSSEAKKRIQQIKNSLILQVVLKEGRFWNEVSEIRARWSIEAPVQLPPEDPRLLYPEQLLPSKAELTEGYILDSHRWETDKGALVVVSGTRTRAIPSGSGLVAFHGGASTLPTSTRPLVGFR